MTSGDVWSVLSQLVAAYGCMLVIPGPNAVVVLRCGYDRSAITPIMASLGVASGAALAAAVAASSAAALPQGEFVKTSGSIVVAALLLRTAWRLARNAPARIALGQPTRRTSRAQPFMSGLGTALLNPVSVPFFAAFWLSHACTGRSMVLACCAVFIMAATWFAFLGLAASKLHRVPFSRSVRRTFNLALALTLIAMAARYVWLAASA